MKTYKALFVVFILFFVSGLVYVYKVKPFNTRSASPGIVSQDLLHVPDSRLKPILTEFAQKSWASVLPDWKNTGGEILGKVINGENVSLEEISQRKQEEADRQLADAPEMRAGFENKIKLCLAESLQSDLKLTLTNCGIKDIRPAAVSWENADDLTASAQVLPYLITGIAYYQNNNQKNANYYFYQVLGHQGKIEELYGQHYNKTTGATYLEIIELTKSLIKVSK